MEATRAEERGDVIRIRALGASEIIIGRKTIGLSAEMVFALGFYLCARAGVRLRREAVAELLWGDAEEKRGRHSLRQMLYKLRQKGLTLDEDGDELYLDPARVESDLTVALSEAWPEEARASEILAAGELLPGLSRAAGPRFQEWLDGLRSQLAAQHRLACLRQIRLARREARWADLDRWAHRVLANDPLNEEATFARAESAAMVGSKVVALEILDQYMEELGDRSVQIGLPAKVLRRRIAERRPEWSTRGPREVPLVGRTELMSRLTGMVEDASRGEGSAVVLWGAPGIGKTRLAEETRGYAELAGFRTVTVRATAAGSTRPLSVLMALIPHLRELPGAAGCDPGALAVLDRVVSGSMERTSLEPARSVGSIREPAQAALNDLLDAITAECRLLVLLDDLHNTDLASWEMLLTLLRGARDLRLFWVATSRLQPSSLQRAGSSRFSYLTALHVPPLDAADTLALTAAVREDGPKRGHPELDERLSRLSGGNPLFIRELSTSSFSARDSETLPRSLRALMEERLAQFEPETARVLRFAALLSPHASVARLRRLHAGAAADLEEAIEHLEQEGVLRLGSARNLELHECWQQAVNDSLAGATRALLAHECAEALYSEDGPSASTDVVWRAAQLFSESGDVTHALGCFSRCADQLMSSGFPLEAVGILEHAYGLVRTTSERMAIGVRLATALHSCWRTDEAVGLCTQLLTQPFEATVSALTDRAIVLSLRMDSLTKCYRDHRGDLTELAALASDQRLTPAARQFICLCGLRVVFNDATSDLEALFYRQSNEIAEKHGVSTTGMLAQLIYCVEHGEITRIQDLIRSLEQTECAGDSIFLKNLALRYRINAIRWLGDTDGALKSAESAFRSFRSGGFVEEAASLSEMMSFACLDANDLEGAAVWLARFESSDQPGLRAHALSHARARLLLQRDDFSGALDCSLPRLEFTTGDLLAKRRVAELATVAYCATKEMRGRLGLQCLESTEEIVRTNDPSRFMDYPAELAVRTRFLMGDVRQANALAEDYARRRVTRHRLPIAPFHSAILAKADEIRPVQT